MISSALKDRTLTKLYNARPTWLAKHRHHLSSLPII